MDLLERMLGVLRQQKQLLQQEISDNKELGLQVGFCVSFTVCLLDSSLSAGFW